MGCWLLTDEDNYPVTNVISWQDERYLAAEKIEYSKEFELFTELNWIEKNGREFRPSIAPLGIYTHLREYGAQRKLRLHSLLSWVSVSIVNSPSHQIHLTDAASLGMVNVKEKQWLDFQGPFKDLIYPEIIESNEWQVSGSVKNLMLSSAVGDQQASLYGAGLDENSVILNIGTGGQIGFLGSLEDSWAFQRRPFFNGLTLNTKTHLPAGRALAFYTRLLTSGNNAVEDYEWMNNSAMEVAPSPNFDLSNFENIEQTYAPKRWDRKFASTVVHSLISSYADILNDCQPLICDKRLIFAGGVGQKLPVIAKYLEIETGMKSEISISIETTIGGLEKLAFEKN